MKGKFITFEGPDGSGKGTIIKYVKKYLEKNKIDYILTREPGGIEISEEIREIILNKNHLSMDERTEALLYAAARRQHLVEIVKPALNIGKIVICDRFVDSSLAYQGYARGIGIDEVLKINEFAIAGLMPDLTIFLNVRPEVGLERINKSKVRQKDRLDLESLDFHKRVYEGYQEVLKQYPDRIISIDAEQSIKRVSEESINSIKTFLENEYF
ncbi:MAG TPA: dTMP kinase [Clostridia bacterium]|nr:dTMP kinase [Clostridia bacterium]